MPGQPAVQLGGVEHPHQQVVFRERQPRRRRPGLALVLLPHALPAAANAERTTCLTCSTLAPPWKPWARRAWAKASSSMSGALAGRAASASTLAVSWVSAVAIPSSIWGRPPAWVMASLGSVLVAAGIHRPSRVAIQPIHWPL